MTRTAIAALVSPLFAVSLLLADCVRATMPDDFASGITITPQTDAAIQRFAVPAAVYSQVTSSTLKDVALFNEAGEAVPFAIHRPHPTRRWLPWQDLPVLPLATAPGTEPASQVKVTLADSGAIVAVDGTTRSDEGSVTIIDASGYEFPIDELELTWDPVRAGSMVRTRVEAGNQLGKWDTEVTNTVLAALEADGHRIAQNRIALQGLEERYLRISMTSDSDVRVTQARVRRAAIDDPDAIEHTAAGPIVTTDDHGELALEFDTQGKFPIESVRLTWPAEPTHAQEVEIFSRATPHDEWSARGRHLFYRTEVDGAVQLGETLEANGSAHRHWRFRAYRSAFSAPASLQMQFAWVPHEVVFLTQGTGNFILAFGSAAPIETQWTLKDLLKMDPDTTSTHALPRALTAAVYELGGPARTRVNRSIPWQRLALWAVLLIGVLIVCGFAWQLVQASTGTPDARVLANENDQEVEAP